jgi:enoyl-CoA hydratase
MVATLTNDENVSIITLDDGKVNVFSPTMIEEVSNLLDKVPTDKGSLLIVGREGIFSAGFDLKVLMSGDAEKAVGMLRSGFEMLSRIFSFPRPIVAACSGHAIALGAFLLCSCDYRVGIKGKFQIGANEVRNNMIVPTPILELAKFKLAKNHKQRALLNGEMYSIEDAVAPGYLDEVVEPDKLIETAKAKAKDLATLGHPFYHQTKQLDQEEVIKKINSGIEKITVSAIMPK